MHAPEIGDSGDADVAQGLIDVVMMWLESRL
jgi:hypothetical protein